MFTCWLTTQHPQAASGGDSVIKYDEASSDRLVVSGSSTGLWLGGGAVIIDSPVTQVTGTLELTGSTQSLLTLHTRDADSLKEIAFLKDGAAAAAIQLNDSEHLFIENENAKDIILRVNNLNALRVVGSQRRVIVGTVSKTTANAQLDVEGTAIVSGTLTTTDDINLLDDKKLNLGNSADALIEYDTNINKLAISGSAAGVELMGGGISLDYPGGTVASGSAAYGSFLAMNASNQVVLSTPHDPAISLKSSTYTATSTDRTLLFNTNSGNLTCNLPAASSNAGLMLSVKKVLGGNNVIIDPNSSELIDGVATHTMTSVNQSVTIQCNGTSWFILSSHSGSHTH